MWFKFDSNSWINLGGLVTVINSEGKPTQIPANSLNLSAIANSAGGLATSGSVAAGIFSSKW